MMAGRPGSNGPDSSSSSMAELPNINVSKLIPHPEEWTIPHEWNIEKREMFENWKLDVQHQIANIASSLDKSLQHYPHPDVGSQFPYYDEQQKAELERTKSDKGQKAGNTLIYGLARSPKATER